MTLYVISSYSISYHIADLELHDAIGGDLLRDALVLISKQRDPNPKDTFLIRKETSTCKAFYVCTIVFLLRSCVWVRVPLLATNVLPAVGEAAVVVGARARVAPGEFREPGFRYLSARLFPRQLQHKNCAEKYQNYGSRNSLLHPPSSTI